MQNEYIEHVHDISIVRDGLLEALQEIASLSPGTSMCIGSCDEMQSIARAAIAKATKGTAQ